jgi:hypothetical protein
MDHHEREKSIEKWQQQRDNTTKGLVNKESFPNIKDRLKMKINLSRNFTAMITAHGKTGSYLHRFKIVQYAECACANGQQTVGDLLLDCSKQNS